jgi:acyl-CoA synthetase (AMP-forming)/AMP-acid ligase II
VSVLPGPPALLSSLLDDPERPMAPGSALRLTMVGAANVPVELIRRLQTETPFATIVTGYGLTESTGLVTQTRAGDSSDRIANSAGCLPISSRGRGKRQDRATAGQAGEILMRSYRDAATGTMTRPSDAVDAQGWLHTGDIGTMDELGYMKITDRKKDMVIVGGFNVYPAEVRRS